jgi:hypothetical protein
MCICPVIFQTVLHCPVTVISFRLPARRLDFATIHLKADYHDCFANSGLSLVVHLWDTPITDLSFTRRLRLPYIPKQLLIRESPRDLSKQRVTALVLPS